jgi:ribonuclease HI
MTTSLRERVNKESALPLDLSRRDQGIILRNESYKIVCDGARNHTTQQGGWAAIIRGPAKKLICPLGYNVLLFGSVAETTVVRMELAAIIRASQYIDASMSVGVYTDSQVASRGFASLDKWAQNGWQTESDHRLLALPFWKALSYQKDRHSSMTVTWLDSPIPLPLKRDHVLVDRVSSMLAKEDTPWGGAIHNIDSFTVIDRNTLLAHKTSIGTRHIGE